MFCCCSKKKKSKKSTQNQELQTNSDYHFLNRDDDISTDPSPQRSYIQPNDAVLIKLQFKQGNILTHEIVQQFKRSTIIRISLNYEHQYVTQLICDQNKLQYYASNYKWTVDLLYIQRSQRQRAQEYNTQIISLSQERQQIKNSVLD